MGYESLVEILRNASNMYGSECLEDIINESMELESIDLCDYLDDDMDDNSK